MFESTAETQADGRFKTGESGNPAGRPRGAKNRATLLAEAVMAEKVGAVVDTLVDRALSGSTGAIRIFLDRTMPVARGCIPFDLPDLRGPRGIADAQEALIIAVAARQVPPRDAERVMKLIDTFKGTLQHENLKAWQEERDAERQRQALAEAAPAQQPAPAAADEHPDLGAYAKMSWPQLIDAMWDAEEAERQAESLPAEPASAEARAADAGDPAPDSAAGPVETVNATSTDANLEINVTPKCPPRALRRGESGMPQFVGYRRAAMDLSCVAGRGLTQSWDGPASRNSWPDRGFRARTGRIAC